MDPLILMVVCIALDVSLKNIYYTSPSISCGIRVNEESTRMQLFAKPLLVQSHSWCSCEMYAICSGIFEYIVSWHGSPSWVSVMSLDVIELNADEQTYLMRLLHLSRRAISRVSVLGIFWWPVWCTLLCTLFLSINIGMGTPIWVNSKHG